MLRQARPKRNATPMRTGSSLKDLPIRLAPGGVTSRGDCTRETNCRIRVDTRGHLPTAGNAAPCRDPGVARRCSSLRRMASMADLLGAPSEVNRRTPTTNYVLLCSRSKLYMRPRFLATLRRARLSRPPPKPVRQHALAHRSRRTMAAFCRPSSAAGRTAGSNRSACSSLTCTSSTARRWPTAPSSTGSSK